MLIGTATTVGIGIPLQNWYAGKALQNPCPYGLTSLSDTPTRNEVILAVVCARQEYGLNQDYDDTIKGESNFNYKAYNKIGKSIGVAQYIFSTFSSMCEGIIIIPKDQIICSAEMFSKGLKFHWDAWCLKYGNEDKNCKRRGF